MLSTIDVMDVTAELSARVERIGCDPLPPSWRLDPGLVDVESFGALVSRLRRLDRRSDEALRALARLADAGEAEACLVATAALLPLLIVRCNRQPELVSEAIPELASRIAEPAREELAGGVANRLLDRVVWRVRHDSGQHTWLDARSHPEAAAAPDTVGFEDPAVDRVALGEFRRRLTRRPHGADAWRLMVRAASPAVVLTSAERTRLAKRRRAVRDLAESSLVP